MMRYYHLELLYNSANTWQPHVVKITGEQVERKEMEGQKGNQTGERNYLTLLARKRVGIWTHSMYLEFMTLEYRIPCIKLASEVLHK